VLKARYFGLRLLVEGIQPTVTALNVERICPYRARHGGAASCVLCRVISHTAMSEFNIFNSNLSIEITIHYADWTCHKGDYLRFRRCTTGAHLHVIVEEKFLKEFPSRFLQASLGRQKGNKDDRNAAFYSTAKKSIYGSVVPGAPAVRRCSGLLLCLPQRAFCR
jgi:hypothetical protein